mmetsp:Transcript_26796/g.86794  ORF Transcript_26796/g.86794 Transcript_26796/m.86794 type:complete len:104 (+) Transcript_26796:159-470(+)
MAAMAVANDIKEAYCYVKAPSTQGRCSEKRHKLPDSREACVGDEQHLAPEILFSPSLAGKEDVGLPEMIEQSIASCDMDIQVALYQSIVLVGVMRCSMDWRSV